MDLHSNEEMGALIDEIKIGLDNTHKLYKRACVGGRYHEAALISRTIDLVRDTLANMARTLHRTILAQLADEIGNKPPHERDKRDIRLEKKVNVHKTR